MYCVFYKTFNSVSPSGNELHYFNVELGLYGAQFSVVFFCSSLLKSLDDGGVISMGSRECRSMMLVLLMQENGDCFLFNKPSAAFSKMA
jgi:hypothetical protein